jgi:hypothetical protein
METWRASIIKIVTSPGKSIPQVNVKNRVSGTSEIQFLQALQALAVQFRNSNSCLSVCLSVSHNKVVLCTPSRFQQTLRCDCTLRTLQNNSDLAELGLMSGVMGAEWMEHHLSHQFKDVTSSLSTYFFVANSADLIVLGAR